MRKWDSKEQIMILNTYLSIFIVKFVPQILCTNKATYHVIKILDTT